MPDNGLGSGPVGTLVVLTKDEPSSVTRDRNRVLVTLPLTGEPPFLLSTLVLLFPFRHGPRSPVRTRGITPRPSDRGVGRSDVVCDWIPTGVDGESTVDLSGERTGFPRVFLAFLTQGSVLPCPPVSTEYYGGGFCCRTYNFISSIRTVLPEKHRYSLV